MAGRIAIVVVFATLAGALLAANLEQSEARRITAQPECGTSHNDWVCRRRGLVTLWPNGTPETTAGSVVGRRPQVLPPYTKVRAEAGAEASVRFREKATCELGPAGVPTQIVTRVGLDGLFSQELGSTFCRSLDGSFAQASFFCNASGSCPVIFLSNGKFDSRGPHQDSGAQISEVTYSRVVITACTGSFELQIFNGEEVETVREKATSPSKIRIVITESVETGEGTSARAWGYHMRSVSAPGICRR